MNNASNQDIFKVKQEIISKIEVLDLANASEQQILSYLSSLLEGVNWKAFITNETWMLYRGIKYKHKPNRFSDIIYPPKDKARINRANYDGEQIFYCTTKKKAVLYELDVQIGDTLVLSSWILNAPVLLNTVGFTETNLIRLGADDRTPFFKSEGIPENAIIVQFIQEYLGKKFCQFYHNTKSYILTIPIAKFLLGEVSGNSLINYSEFEGLVYPTIRYSANAHNLALKPLVIEQSKIFLDRVEFIEIMNIYDNKYEYRIVDISDKQNQGALIWKELNNSWLLNDEDDDLYFVDGVAYNELGEEVSPIKS